MKIEAHDDVANHTKVYTITVPNDALAMIDFDAFDTSVLNSKIENPSDILQDLWITFFRYEQQITNTTDRKELPWIQEQE